jgi:hypothetical protein
MAEGENPDEALLTKNDRENSWEKHSNHQAENIGHFENKRK